MKMKNLMFTGLILIALTILSSCGSGAVESDAKKLAELQCKAQNLDEKVSSGDEAALEESLELAGEIIELAAELEEKYKSDSELEEFRQALAKEMGNCN
jgi:hypothetical protein